MNKWKSRRWIILCLILIWGITLVTSIVFIGNGNYENLAITVFTGTAGTVITYLINDTKEKIKYMEDKK